MRNLAEHLVVGKMIDRFYQNSIVGQLASSKGLVHSLLGDFVTDTLLDTLIMLQLNPVPNPPRGHTSNNNNGYDSLEKEPLNNITT